MNGTFSLASKPNSIYFHATRPERERSPSIWWSLFQLLITAYCFVSLTSTTLHHTLADANPSMDAIGF